MRSPLDKSHRITSYFGNRVIGGKPDMHMGIDLVPYDGKHPTEIFAVTGGVVESVRNTIPDSHTGISVASYVTGNFVNVKTPENFTIIYRHLKCGSVKVKPGKKVKAGDPLGIMGSTGRSTGIHLHFQINGPDGGAIDPLSYLATERELSQPQPEDGLSVGDTVGLKPTAKTYASSPAVAIPAWVKQNKYTVQQINGAGDKILLKEIYSWVYRDDLDTASGS